MLAKLSDEELAPIWNEVNKIKNNFQESEKSNHYLAGNIKYEFELRECREYIANLIAPLVHFYEEKIKLITDDINRNKDKPIGLNLNGLWVNFMKKNEFNPPHIHSGIYSFVIWLNIPYEITNEMKRDESKEATYNCPGHFLFQFNNSLGLLQNNKIPVDKNWNGTLCMFPSALMHSVMPFYTSDDYRITIAGNLSLN